MLAMANAADLTFLKELIEAARVTPIIDRTYPLSAARDAIRYLTVGSHQNGVTHASGHPERPF
jgi:hypothetical protein